MCVMGLIVAVYIKIINSLVCIFLCFCYIMSPSLVCVKKEWESLLLTGVFIYSLFWWVGISFSLPFLSGNMHPSFSFVLRTLYIFILFFPKLGYNLCWATYTSINICYITWPVKLFNTFITVHYLFLCH